VARPKPSIPVRTGQGNVAAEIPRAVFIRAVGLHLVVTTNTGLPPQPRDTYYYIAHGHAGPASAMLRSQVQSGCHN
jgi:hypothetical protein